MRPPVVLVVDDEPVVSDAIRVVLEMVGFEVRCAAGGDAVLALLEGGVVVSVALVDREMPGMSGAALIHALRRRWPELPIVLMSGHAEDVARGGLAVHGDSVGYLSKPFRPTELTAALVGALSELAIG